MLRADVSICLNHAMSRQYFPLKTCPTKTVLAVVERDSMLISILGSGGDSNSYGIGQH